MRISPPRSTLIPPQWLLCAAAATFLCTNALVAQSPYASVRGIVTDTEGRALARVEVRATQSSTGLTQTTTTGSKGEYYFGSLPRGVYALKFALEGYQPRTK